MKAPDLYFKIKTSKIYVGAKGLSITSVTSTIKSKMHWFQLKLLNIIHIFLKFIVKFYKNETLSYNILCGNQEKQSLVNCVRLEN